MIDNHVRTDFIDMLLGQARRRFHRCAIVLAVFLADFMILVAIGLPALIPGLITAVILSARFIYSYFDLGRAYSSLEAVYRREDSQCRPWG
jgi:hypothetical protein